MDSSSSCLLRGIMAMVAKRSPGIPAWFLVRLPAERMEKHLQGAINVALGTCLGQAGSSALAASLPLCSGSSGDHIKVCALPHLQSVASSDAERVTPQTTPVGKELTALFGIQAFRHCAGMERSRQPHSMWTSSGLSNVTAQKGVCCWCCH